MSFEQETKGYVAQIEAAKQMCNEALASNLQLRTNVLILQEAHHSELVQKQEAHTQIETLKAKVFELANKILELQPVPELPVEEPANPETPDAA